MPCNIAHVNVVRVHVLVVHAYPLKIQSGISNLCENLHQQKFPAIQYEFIQKVQHHKVDTDSAKKLMRLLWAKHGEREREQKRKWKPGKGRQIPIIWNGMVEQNSGMLPTQRAFI